jgi:hypothetical protein
VSLDLNSSPNDYDMYHLLFDPCVSPHYQVVVFRELYRPRVDASEITEDGSAEWPPSPYMMWVYSSETRRWEDTPFVREGVLQEPLLRCDQPNTSLSTIMLSTTMEHCMQNARAILS